MPALLGYWKLRGLGASIRLLLEYTETDYTEKRYNLGPAPDFDGSEWTNEKFSLGMDLPNLPYYFDGPHKITQSNAILRYIARKHNLCGTTEEEIIKVDMLENQAMDMRTAWVKLVYDSDKNFAANKVTYANSFPATLKLLNELIGNNKWFAGSNGFIFYDRSKIETTGWITFVDFLLYESLDVNRTLFTDCLGNFTNLENFMVRFESLEKIKKYMNSPRYMKTPINGPMAAFVGE